MSKKIAVVGGGAAGLMAAGEAASFGADVALFEKNEKLGKKLAITGKGRCNVTNLCGVGEFLSNVATNPKFLHSALNFFGPADCVDFFEKLGVRLKTERGKRVFPASDSAFEIVDALKKFAGGNGVKTRRAAVEKLLICDSKIAGIVAGGQKYDFDRVILCTGGMSYPKTGSTGDGYRLAAQAGHDIIRPRPSLVPLEIEEKFCADAMGLSLKNVKLRLYEGDREIFGEMGELLFTHFGISGPLALSASSHMREKNKSYAIKLDLKPALSAEQLDKRILSDFEKCKNKMFKNSLDGLLPKKLIPVFVEILKEAIGPEKKINEITKAERSKLAGLFKDFTMNFKAFRPMDEAIITCGGVETDEIRPNTMESKLTGGLYFAGEIIDVDAYTGGFNLQIAFSTGKLAGKSAAGG